MYIKCIPCFETMEIRINVCFTDVFSYFKINVKKKKKIFIDKIFRLRKQISLFH